MWGTLWAPLCSRVSIENEKKCMLDCKQMLVFLGGGHLEGASIVAPTCAKVSQGEL